MLISFFRCLCCVSDAKLRECHRICSNPMLPGSSPSLVHISEGVFGVLPHRKWSSGPAAGPGHGVTRCAAVACLAASCAIPAAGCLPSFSSAFSSCTTTKPTICLFAQGDPRSTWSWDISNIPLFLSTTRPFKCIVALHKRPSPDWIIITQQTQHKTRHDAQAQLWANTRAADPSPRNTTQPRFPNLGLLLPALCVEVKQPLPGATGIGRHVLRM